MELFVELARGAAAEQAYTSTVAAIRRRSPGIQPKSYNGIKRHVSKLTGIHPIRSDMCIGTCMAYTGPYSHLDSCLICGTLRVSPSTQKPRRQFYTLPIGPYLQMLYRDAKTADRMGYFGERLETLLRQAEPVAEFDDICCGSNVLKAMASGKVEKDDVYLMTSMDGAQLYRNKASDCWIYIWILLGFSPDCRYKKKYIIPGAVFPGPNGPKITESFLFPGLHHIAAINKSGGLPIWNAHTNHGCRVWCGQLGRHKPGDGCYFPALFKPDNYAVAGCDFGDLDPALVLPGDPEKFRENLCILLSSQTQNAYKANRKATGISKPSIFLGMHPDTILGIPSMFPGDIMHLILNLADLLIPFHGKDVADATPHLPGSFDRPPRNPAEKINSGYKAWEFLLYLFGLGPGLLYGLLPTRYWTNFCKLCAGIRLLYQHKITQKQLQTMHVLLIQFTVEFEILYVRRNPSRLHYMRQCIHNLRHAALETMERCIGDLTGEIHQDSNPYANLSERCIKRAQINALKAAIPELDADRDKESRLPRGAMTSIEKDALERYVCAEFDSLVIPRGWEVERVLRWARLRLPNGQIARSAWTEKQRDPTKVRNARNVKLVHQRELRFAEVQYYFRLEIDEQEVQDLAMVILYGKPDEELLRNSSSTLWTCMHGGNGATMVISVKNVKSVVAMVPHSTSILGDGWKDRVFVVEKPGLDVVEMGGYLEDDDPEDEQAIDS
ncbi:hypothetical protein F5050DRAFT_1799474 [Lentinula boryana]|uniref:Uncharacterized protein n=1 Tax=Lentinula boryana TaxID=40481 RepID=A0ABQ8QDY9_9AGAR|nr:hypothetical protein F5050DRAFT_1799474 [Lentinula boryana]